MCTLDETSVPAGSDAFARLTCASVRCARRKSSLYNRFPPSCCSEPRCSSRRSLLGTATPRACVFETTMSCHQTTYNQRDRMERTRSRVVRVGERKTDKRQMCSIRYSQSNAINQRALRIDRTWGSPQAVWVRRYERQSVTLGTQQSQGYHCRHNHQFRRCYRPCFSFSCLVYHHVHHRNAEDRKGGGVSHT